MFEQGATHTHANAYARAGALCLVLEQYSSYLTPHFKFDCRFLFLTYDNVCADSFHGKLLFLSGQNLGLRFLILILLDPAR